jgi:hypothetical protein
VDLSPLCRLASFLFQVAALGFISSPLEISAFVLRRCNLSFQSGLLRSAPVRVLLRSRLMLLGFGQVRVQ